MRAWIALSFVSAILAPSFARADAIVMPESCPESSEDAFCHGPATCRPRGCVSSTDCHAGEVCAARNLCTETHTCFMSPSGALVDHVLGACDASGACPSGGACGSLFVCAPGPMLVDAATPTDAARSDAGIVPEHATYCGCRVGERHGASGLVLMLSAFGVFVRRRRR